MYACTQFGNPVMAEAADIAVNVSVLYSCLNIVLQHIRSVFDSNLCFVLFVTSCKHCEEISKGNHMNSSVIGK